MTLQWRQRKAPDVWKKPIIVLLHKGKSNKDSCNNCRETNNEAAPFLDDVKEAVELS